jgi:hypothetical protein
MVSAFIACRGLKKRAASAWVIRIVLVQLYYSLLAKAERKNKKTKNLVLEVEEGEEMLYWR